MALIYFILLVGLISIETVYSVCNVCGADTQIACINQTAFRRCSGSSTVPGSTAICPSGTFCNSDAAIRCVTSDPSCGGSCGVCNQNTYIACLSRTQYAFCFGTSPSDQTGFCSTEEYCNSEYPGICINSADPIVAEPTCPNIEPPTTTISPITTTLSTTTTSSTITPTTTVPITTRSTTTTISPITEAQKFCISIGKAGKFPKINDTNCKKYYYCYYLGANLNGQEYTCVGLTFYNCQTQMCSYVCNKSCPLTQISENYRKSRILNTVA